MGWRWRWGAGCLCLCWVAALLVFLWPGVDFASNPFTRIKVTGHALPSFCSLVPGIP
jgi:hypothetical protein